MTDTAVKQWYIARDGKQTGPISDVEISTIAGMGYFRATDLVWRPGLAEWQPALTQFPPQTAQPIAVPPAPVAPPNMAPSQRTPASAPANEPSRPAEAMRPRAPEAFQPSPQHHRPLPLDTPVTARGATERSQTKDSAERSQLRTAPERNQRTAPPGDLRMQRDNREPTARPSPSRAPASPPSQQPAARPLSVEATAPVKSNRGPIIILAALVLSVSAAVWGAANPDWRARAATVFASLTASAPAPDQLPTAPSKPPGAEPSGPQLAEMDERLQHTAHWPVLKRVFPEWYSDRLREAARLKIEQRTDEDISKALVDQIVALRRQNVSQALSASGPRLKAMASAFLDNLKQLKAQSTQTCYNFISRGETTPGVINLLQSSPGTPPLLQLQVAAIFEAIDEGRATPIAHQRPQKTDFDVLMEQLGKLGWTQNDVATFADPDKLAKAEPDRVCQMVQDWFVALIAIPDPGVQERLLSETLRPVVAG